LQIYRNLETPSLWQRLNSCGELCLNPAPESHQTHSMTPGDDYAILLHPIRQKNIKINFFWGVKINENWAFVLPLL